MASYTPGLLVSGRTRHRASRRLPVSGEVLAEAGQSVAARDVVARAAMPGDVFPVNLANKLAVGPADVPGCLLVSVGDAVTAGQVIARSPGFFGLFKTEYAAAQSGTVESVSEITGQLILRGPDEPVEVRAYLAGEVVETTPGRGVEIEADAALIQGIFGIGGEAYGRVRCVCESPERPLTPAQIPSDSAGCVIVGGARMSRAAIQAAIDARAAAVVSGGMDDSDLKDLLGYDLGVAVTGTERLGTTVIVTEGFGEIAMAARTFELLKQHEGADAAVNGTTQIRAGVLRPEIVIPLEEETRFLNGAENASTDSSRDGVESADRDSRNRVSAPPAGLAVGAPVRMIRDPYFGRLGTVAELPTEPTVLESESRARVLVVESGGERVTVPRANVELIEGAGA